MFLILEEVQMHHQLQVMLKDIFLNSKKLYGKFLNNIR